MENQSVGGPARIVRDGCRSWLRLAEKRSEEAMQLVDDLVAVKARACHHCSEDLHSWLGGRGCLAFVAISCATAFTNSLV